jgi:hypothetical protein
MTTSSTSAQTLRFQGLANLVVRGLLRTPLLCRVAGRRLITLYLVGRKTGNKYTIPVAYTNDHGTVLFGTPFGWGRNLRTGERVEIRYLGSRVPADVQVIADADGVAANYAVMVRDNRQFAKFNKIRVDSGGEPLPADLHRAWADGARAFRLTPLR